MHPRVMPSRNTLTNCLGALMKLPTTHTTNRPTTTHVRTRLICCEKRGSAAMTGRRLVPDWAVIAALPRVLSLRRERLHEIRLRCEHLVGGELSTLDDVDRHRALVGVTGVVDRERAEHAVGDGGAEQVFRDAGPRAVGGRDGVQDDLSRGGRVRCVRVDEVG